MLWLTPKKWERRLLFEMPSGVRRLFAGGKRSFLAGKPSFGLGKPSFAPVKRKVLLLSMTANKLYMC